MKSLYKALRAFYVAEIRYPSRIWHSYESVKNAQQRKYSSLLCCTDASCFHRIGAVSLDLVLLSLLQQFNGEPGTILAVERGLTHYGLLSSLLLIKI